MGLREIAAESVKTIKGENGKQRKSRARAGQGQEQGKGKDSDKPRAGMENGRRGQEDQEAKPLPQSGRTAKMNSNKADGIYYLCAHIVVETSDEGCPTGKQLLAHDGGGQPHEEGSITNLRAGREAGDARTYDLRPSLHEAVLVVGRFEAFLAHHLVEDRA